MSAKPDFFRIGLFIVGGVALLVAALLVFGGGQFFKPRLMLETYVGSSVQGIDIGSQVKFRGVLIGKVTNVSFVFTEYDLKAEVGYSNYVVINMQIDREVFPGMLEDDDLTPLLNRGIEQGLRVRIQPQGITGLNYLDIDYVDPERYPPFWPSWKPRYYYIPSAPGEITSFLDSINEILREVEKLNIGGLSESGAQLLANLNTAVSDLNVRKISEDLQKLVTNFDSTLSDAQLPALSADIRKFLTEVEASNTELKKILKNIEPSTRLNSDQVNAIVSNLTTTTENLEQLSAEVKRRPSLILWGTPRPPKPTPTPKPAKPTRRGVEQQATR